MSTIKRYDPEQYDDFGYRGVGTMREDEYGDWVSYDDHKDALKRAETALVEAVAFLRRHTAGQEANSIAAEIERLL